MPHRPTASTCLTGAAIWLVAVVVLLRAVSPSTIRYDYQRAFYAAGTAVLEHQSLYASALHQLETKASSPSLSPYERAHTYIPYLYPPPYALFLAGLSAMPYEAAARVFYWINVAFLFLIAFLIGSALGSRCRWFLPSALAAVPVLWAVGVAVPRPGSCIDYLHASRRAAHPLVVAFPFAFGLMAFAYRALTATPYATPLIALPPALVGGAVVAVAVVLA